MAYQSEFALETEMMEQLKSNGYETVTIRNEQQLLDNFRTILNERHANKLNGEPLTDKEFQRLLTMIDGKGIFESARILRDKMPLKRDDEIILYYTYRTAPKMKFSKENPINLGTTRLVIKGEILEGNYWTARNTVGDINMEKKC